MLIHIASARDPAGFNQPVMMPATVRAWVVSDTPVGGARQWGGIEVFVEAAGHLPCIDSVLGFLDLGMQLCGMFGRLVGAVCCVEVGMFARGVMGG